MANVLDAAAYILDRQGSMPTWKLQKLVYYTHQLQKKSREAPVRPDIH